jgi:tight adherence protein C
MSFIVYIIIAVVVIIGIAALLTYVGLRNPEADTERILQDRLEEFNQKGEDVSLEKIEMSQPFSQRVIYPLARGFGEFAVKFTPQNALQNIARMLELSGSPSSLDPQVFLAMQIILAVFLGGLMVLVFTVGETKLEPIMLLIVTLVAAVLGYFVPMLLLQSRIGRRQKDVRRSMPDALDLLTICVEAGLGFDAAMQKVSEKWETELSIAFSRVLREIQLGKLRREALRDMADRIGLNELTSFVAAVIQSESLGVSLAKVLRIQSDQMRIKRRQLAEEEAHKAPIKMLIPMALLIFPSLMIVLLTPAGLRLFHSALGSMMK